MLRTEDPIEVELIASMLLGGLFPLGDMRPPPDDEAFEDLVATMAHPPSDEGLAMLLAVAAVAEPPLADLARDAATRMPGPRLSPSWVGSIGRARVLRAWRGSHPFGDQDGIFLSFAHPERAPGLASVVVDRTIGNIVKDVMVVPEVDWVLERWRKEPDATLEEIPVGEAAGVILRALGNTEATIDAPVTEDFVANRLFLRGLLRTVEDVMMPLEPEPLPQTDVNRLVTEFMASEEAASLGPEAELAANTLLAYQCQWRADNPFRWSPMVIEMCLLDWLPRKTALDEEELTVIPDTVRALVRYAARRRSLPDHLIAETLDAVDQFEAEYLEAMRDPSMRSPSTNLTVAMQRDGVNFLDKPSVDAWIEDFNAKPIEERDRILGGELD